MGTKEFVDVSGELGFVMGNLAVLQTVFLHWNSLSDGFKSETADGVVWLLDGCIEKLKNAEGKLYPDEGRV